MFRNILKFFHKKSKSTDILYCKRCGRRLINNESKKIGFGKCCLKKECEHHSKTLF